MPSPFKMIWDGCRNQRPEFLAVAGMFQVSQLMHDHILESGYGKPHQGHVESDRPGSVIARTPSGTHSAISDQGWLRHPHDRHPRVEQWPGNAFYFTASEHGDGSFPGHFTRPRNYEPMAGNPGTSPASSPVLHVVPSAPQPGPPPVLEPVGLTGRFSQLLALPIYPGPLLQNPALYHGINAGGAKAERPTFTAVFAEAIVRAAKKDKRIVAVTAAMTDGTGLTEFEKCFPERFFDVGIAEQHAVTFAGGLARAGLKPVVAIYSTFIQRAVDQLIHDIALQNIPAVFMLDRSGPVPDDGETHQGVFDISLLRPVPNVSLLAPATQRELELCFEWALAQKTPTVIRYSKGECPEQTDACSQNVCTGRGVLLTDGAPAKDKVLLVCTGGIFSETKQAADELKKYGKSADIYNLRFLKPLDKDWFLSVAAPYERVLFIEDGIRIGGIGTYLESLLDRRLPGKKTGVSGFPDRFFAQGSRNQILCDVHLDGVSLAQKALRLWE